MKKINTAFIVATFILLVATLGVLIYIGNNLDFSNVFSFTNQIQLPDLDLENIEVDATCSDYNIDSEYRDQFGSTNIDLLADACNIDGVWREGTDRLGCAFDITESTPDCGSTNTITLEQFCNHLKGEWVCANDIGFVGCLCNVAIVPSLRCWWSEVGNVNNAMLGFSFIEWEELLPEGKFRYVWSTSGSDEMSLEIYRPYGTLIEQFISDTDGTYYFTSDGETWGVGIDNYGASELYYDISLEQWVCENDNLNWQSSMFSSPHYQEQYGGYESLDCNTICQEIGWYGGMDYIDPCYPWQVVYTHNSGKECCCNTQQIM